MNSCIVRDGFTESVRHQSFESFRCHLTQTSCGDELKFWQLRESRKPLVGDGITPGDIDGVKVFEILSNEGHGIVPSAIAAVHVERVQIGKVLEEFEMEVGLPAILPYAKFREICEARQGISNLSW